MQPLQTHPAAPLCAHCAWQVFTGAANVTAGTNYRTAQERACRFKMKGRGRHSKVDSGLGANTDWPAAGWAGWNRRCGWERKGR